MQQKGLDITAAILTYLIRLTSVRLSQRHEFLMTALSQDARNLLNLCKRDEEKLDGLHRVPSNIPGL
jgi:hypothetical protein